jgi:hypothetical protein
MARLSQLKLALIQATERWEELTGGGVPCPIEFDAEDVRETKKLDEVQANADWRFEFWQNVIGLGEDAGCRLRTTGMLWHS